MTTLYLDYMLRYYAVKGYCTGCMTRIEFEKQIKIEPVIVGEYAFTI